MENAGWLPLAAEPMDQDLTAALATHEAIVEGLRRLVRAVKGDSAGACPAPGRDA